MTSIVAAIQFEPKFLDVRENITRALALVHEAALKGARVIVLPELAMSGFGITEIGDAMMCAQTKDGYQTEAFTYVARTFNCHVVVGYVELNDGKLYNSAAIIGPSGLAANVQKHNLHGSDNLWATPSEQLSPCVVTNEGRIGALVCRDVRNNYRETYRFYRPQHRFYYRGSVDTIALLTNWGNGYSYPDSSWIELAESTDANVIVSNRIGSENDMKYKGGSAVIDRNLRVWTNGSSFDAPAIVGGITI